jgi:hypothetical protein
MLKQNLLVTASAIALFAAMATTSVSQSPSGGSSGAQEQQKEQQKMSPGSSDSGRGGGAQERGATDEPKGKGGSAQRDTEPRPKASDRAEEKASPKSRVQGQDATPKASDRAQEKASPKSAVQGQKKDDDDDDRRSRAAGDKGKDTTKQSDQGQAKDRDRAAGDADKRGDRAGKGEAKDAPKQSDKGSAKDRDRAADSTKDGRDDRQRGDRAEGDRGSGERTQLSEQKRTSVRERMSKSARANRVTNVNFDIRVGASVPRDTTLHVLPPDVVEIVPEYRGYRYVYVRDEIVIIHPTNYTVVTVIGGGAQVGSRSGERITLASDDRVFIRQHVDLGARVRLGIGSISIGMDLPDTVELRPLPDVIVQRNPDLRGHRYFVYEEDVVIVEPESRQVVLVIED